MKSVSCVISICVIHRNAVSNLALGARLQNFWQTWLDLGAGPKVVQILREGYTLPFRNRPKLTRFPTVISCYVNPHRNSYLLEALHQLIDKNAVELVQNQTSLGFFNRLFLVPKPNKWRPILDLSKLNLFLKAEKFKMETPETIRTSLQQGVGHLNRFQGRLLPYTNTGTVQEISEISCPGSDIPILSTVLWSVHSTLGDHCGSKGGETDGHTQGYKNPPVPRRLVGESYIPPGLSPTHSRSSENLPRTRLTGEFGKIRTGTKTDLQFCRLPVRPQGRSGSTHTGPLAEPSGQNFRNTVTTGLSGPAVHVPNRFVNSYREASSPRPTTHETHTVASRKQLEGTRITGKGDPNSQVPAPPFTMVATGRQHSYRPTITPNKACSANLYRRLKRRVGRSLKRTHYKRVLVTTGKQAAYKLSGTKSSISTFERISRPLCRPDSTGGNRQHHSSVLHKQGRRHEVGPTLCPIMENLDLVHQETSNSQSPTHSRPAECGSRQAIQARPEHSNRVVSPSRNFPSYMQQVAPASSRLVCHEVQQQVTSVCVTGSPGHSSGCTQSAMGGSGRICLSNSSHLGQSGGEVTGHSMQENHCDYPEVAKHVVVLGSGVGLL